MKIDRPARGYGSSAGRSCGRRAGFFCTVSPTQPCCIFKRTDPFLIAEKLFPDSDTPNGIPPSTSERIFISSKKRKKRKKCRFESFPMKLDRRVSILVLLLLDFIFLFLLLRKSYSGGLKRYTCCGVGSIAAQIKIIIRSAKDIWA